jgi:hypothetical protein
MLHFVQHDIEFPLPGVASLWPAKFVRGSFSARLNRDAEAQSVQSAPKIR